MESLGYINVSSVDINISLFRLLVFVKYVLNCLLTKKLEVYIS